jgi:isoleucyl-tRNA synthetase
MTKPDGSLVIAIDCQQDDAILSAGMSRELINGIQQLRKAAGLDLSDVVEIFYEEGEGETMVEDAVAKNVAVFEAKFQRRSSSSEKVCS